jgi:SAM-dependent methyltransferase
LAQLHRKNPDIETRLADFNQLDFNEEFDGIISTFAGLNTSPNLNQFAASAARLLRPEGVLFVHLLNRFPVLEIARQFIHLHWRACWQTMTASQRKVNVGNIVLPHYLYSPLWLYRNVFASDFRLTHIAGQGFIRPLESAWGEHVESLERRLASAFPFHSAGIFFSLEMTRA